MTTLLKAVSVLVVLSSSLVLADLPQGEVVIRTRKGGLVMGRVLSETAKGYLVAGPDGTSVVEFANITDVRQLASSSPTAAPPPPVVTVAAAPSAPAPVAARVEEAPPAPPARPAEPRISEVTANASDSEKGRREGFHFGLGLGAMMLPAGPMGQLEAHFEVNFGRPAYRATVSVGLLGVYDWKFLNVSVDNLFQFHVGDVYAFGAGLKLGFTTIARTYVYVAPVLQPVLITLGDRGQHQLSLTGSVAILSNVEEYYDSDTRRTSEISFAGTVQAFLGYAYLF